MTKAQLKAFIATPKGKLVAVCSLLVLSWIFLLFYFFGDAIAAFGDPQSLEYARRELKRMRASCAGTAEKYEEWESQKKRYRAIVAEAWRESRDGQVETALRQKVTEAVSELNFKLSSLGSVSTGRINNDLYYADIDISAEGPLDEIVKLISALEGIRPAPKWKRLNLRPDNRPRFQSGSTTVLNLAQQNEAVVYTRVAMNATLRVVCADEAEAPGAAAPGERSARP